MAQSEVKVLRLKVGDFIIAKVSEMKDSYTMDKPMALGFVGAGDTGQGTLQFAPWFPFTDKRDINIKKKFPWPKTALLLFSYIKKSTRANARRRRHNIPHLRKGEMYIL